MASIAQLVSRDARPGFGAGMVAVIASIALVALLAAAVSPQPAAAVSKVPKGALKKLRRSSCPPKYAVRVTRPADRDEIRAAKKGNFEIAGRDVHISRHMNWAYDPVGSASFRARLNDLRWLDPLFYAYRTNGDIRALKRAKAIVADWIKSNPLRAPTNDRTWFDKVAGDRAPYIAYATRAAECEGLLRNPGLAKVLLGSVQQHIRFLAGPKRYSPTNRGLFMDLGLIFSGRQMRFLPGASQARKRGRVRFLNNVDNHVIPGEGMWLEHSSSYQFLTINAMERFTEIEQKRRKHLNSLLRTMRDTAAWMTEPDRGVLQNGDSFGDKADRFAQMLSRDQRGMRVLPRSGVAFVKKRKSYLALLSNYHSEIHRHSDDLSFDLSEHGHRVVSDTGIPDKDFGTPYLFAISSDAHSVVQVDGMDFPRDASHAYGSGILASGEGDGWYALKATNPLDVAQGVSHERTLLYKPGSALIVADRLRSSGTHTYTSRFQFGPDFGLRATKEKLQLFAGPDQVSVFNESTASLQRQVVRGQKDPLLGFVYTDFRERDPRWVETTIARGSDVDNVTTISTDPDKEIHAVASAPLGETSSFLINEDGVTKKTLTVTRQGGQLTVEQVKLPKTG